ncbi:hypothetical protein [Pannonibacter indicus]|uniref:Uncharacterized protein n=1 Tax=Pannonibacter indicus TaxID=466044 RepID=A0A0K6HYB8_9HYPH|nr:hypothetical protein [Pannonibacter indicus]CUA95875.1 hypothetical protein Ga0061067_104198 [Pannonibacter indicus]
MNELFSILGPESKEGFNAYDGLAQTMHAAGQLAGAEAAYSYMVPQMWRLFGGDNPELTYAFVLFEHCGRVRCAAKRR